MIVELLTQNLVYMKIEFPGNPSVLESWKILSYPRSTGNVCRIESLDGCCEICGGERIIIGGRVKKKGMQKGDLF